MHVHLRRAIDASASLTASVAARIEAEVERAVLGQEAAVHDLLAGLLAGGPCLMTGPAGVGKTRAARAVALALGVPCVEIAGAPDAREARLPPRCVVVIDALARVPPSVRLPLLEQEAAAAIVLATHDPRETAEWPLTGAELDRFLLSVPFAYPTAEEERDLLRRAASGRDDAARATVDLSELTDAWAEVRDVPAASNVIEYAARLARSTRPVHDGEAAAFVHELVASGAGPRGTLALMAAARAHALVGGAAAVSLDDVDAVAPAVLRHRVFVSEAARRQGLTADDVISRILPGARA